MKKIIKLYRNKLLKYLISIIREEDLFNLPEYPSESIYYINNNEFKSCSRLLNDIECCDDVSENLILDIRIFMEECQQELELYEEREKKIEEWGEQWKSLAIDLLMEKNNVEILDHLSINHKVTSKIKKMYFKGEL